MAADLHEHAVEAGRHLSALSTGLSKAGAPPEAVDAVTQCEDIVRKVTKVLGSPEPNPPEADQSPEADGGEPEPSTIGGATQAMMADRRSP